MKKSMYLQVVVAIVVGIGIGVLMMRGFISPLAAVHAEDISADSRRDVVVPVPAPVNFQFRVASTNSGERVILRFNPRTGEAWSNSTLFAVEWVRVAEEKAPPEGDYDIFVLKARDTKADYFATRVDLKSGKAWHLGDKWIEFKEPK